MWCRIVWYVLIMKPRSIIFIFIDIEVTIYCIIISTAVTFHWTRFVQWNFLFYLILGTQLLNFFATSFYASQHYMRVAYLNYIYILKSNCFLQDGGSTDKKSYVKLFLLCQSLLTYDSRFHTNTPNILFPIKLM